jgi:hypothetical protein
MVSKKQLFFIINLIVVGSSLYAMEEKDVITPGADKKSTDICQLVIRQSTQAIMDNLPQCLADPVFLVAQHESIRDLVRVVNLCNLTKQADALAPRQNWDDQMLHNLVEAKTTLIEHRAQFEEKIQQVLRENGFFEIVVGKIVDVLRSESKEFESLPYTPQALLHNGTRDEVDEVEGEDSLLAFSSNNEAEGKKKRKREKTEKVKKLKKESNKKQKRNNNISSDPKIMIEKYNLKTIENDKPLCPFPNCETKTIYRNGQSLLQHLRTKHASQFKNMQVSYSSLVRYLWDPK